MTTMIVAVYRRSCAIDGNDQERTEKEAHLLSINTHTATGARTEPTLTDL